jgi:hypothetical protein
MSTKDESGRGGAMSDEPKSLTPELLPDPAQARSHRDGPARDRVVRHLRRLVVTGGAATLSALPCCACDPLPPPARCRPVGPASNSVHAGATLSSGSILVSLNLTEGFTLATVRVVSGGKLISNSGPGSTRASLEISPAPTASAVTVDLGLNCSATASDVRLVITGLPVASDGGVLDGGSSGTLLSVTVTDASASDAGP